MSAFAFYRLPYKDHYTLVMQHDDDPEKLNSVNELNGKHGFVIAPFMPSGETQLYVSLRCMNIHQGGNFQLYAGGGLLAESEMQKEWEETEAKLGTMRAVISK